MVPRGSPQRASVRQSLHDRRTSTVIPGDRSPLLTLYHVSRTLSLVASWGNGRWRTDHLSVSAFTYPITLSLSDGFHDALTALTLSSDLPGPVPYPC
jgi:hypothetical protein